MNQEALEQEPNRNAGRLFRVFELLTFVAAIGCLVAEKNKTAVMFLLGSLLVGGFASFQLRQEDTEKVPQRFWFGLLGKTLVNVIFLILFLRIVWRPGQSFPTVLCVGLVCLTLRNIFYLAFSVGLLKEKKSLPLNSIWGKITTAFLNVTMLLYTLRIEHLHIKMWGIVKEIKNLSNIAMVFSLMMVLATSIGYLYFYYRDPDHRKPISVASQLTISRIILSPVFMWVFFYDSNLNYQDNSFTFKIVALLMVIFFAISDGLDGHLARKFGQVSKLGKYLDPFSDKISNMSIFLCFLASNYATVWMIALIYFREATVETLRTLGASEGLVIDARKSGKWKTGIQVGAVIVILTGAIVDSLILKHAPEVSWWKPFWNILPHGVMYAVTVITVLSGVDYIVSNMKIIRKYV